jgi:hypothetical protein
LRRKETEYNEMLFILRKLPCFILLIAFAGFLACEEKIDFIEVDCSECYRTKPDTGTLKIKITINKENESVPIVVYRNEMEKEWIRLVDTVTYEEYYIDVAINHYYSVKAEYKVDGKTIFAVDGDKIRTRKITAQCDSTCWVIRGGNINVKLKYKDTP